MKSFLVIGMGRFGRHLASKLWSLGNDVLIVDKNEDTINELASKFTDAYIGDATNEEVIKALGVHNFDICFVTIGDNFQSSLEITSLLKEHKAKHIVSKATRDMQAKFLTQIGADTVVYPERDLATSLAIKYNANNVYDYIQLDDSYALYEIPILSEWIGKTIVEVNIRRIYNVNVIAIKQNDKLLSTSIVEHKFVNGDHIMIIGKKTDVERLTSKI